MKELLKTYSPVAFVFAGALCYWAFGSIAAKGAENELLREQNRNIVLGMTQNCEVLLADQGKLIVDAPAEEESEDASSADTLK